MSDLTVRRTPRTRVGERLEGLWSFRGRYRTLHLTWFAFFLSFVVWFNMAPFAITIGEQLSLSKAQLGVLALCNVAMTVPARIVVGMALDRFGPRRVYAAILIFSTVPCLVFALASSFPMLAFSRLALGIVGAGFVVGIRMISEWFPPKELGLAEGIYGGWGNFGSAAAAMGLPLVAGVVGGEDGWRWAIALTGIIAGAYGLYYLRAAADTPEGIAYVRPKRHGALEVTSRPGVFGLIATTVPLVGVLDLIAWRLQRAGAISTSVMWIVVALTVALLASQVRRIITVNAPALADAHPKSERYPFRSVVVLCVAYACCFGSELAVVSMLPTFFAQTWGLGPALAGATASAFAFMNLFARPAGGLLSDLLPSRRRTLTLLLGCLAGGYLLMALLGAAWPVPLAVVVAMVCSFFVQSSEGAVYAIVPLVNKRVGGQIAGMVGAYGNVGAIAFLTVLLFVTPSVFFLVIAAASILGTLACRWLVEPARSFDEHLIVLDDDDRTVALEDEELVG